MQPETQPETQNVVQFPRLDRAENAESRAMGGTHRRSMLWWAVVCFFYGLGVGALIRWGVWS